MTTNGPQDQQRVDSSKQLIPESAARSQSSSDSTKRDSASPTMTNYSFEANDEQTLQAVREMRQSNRATPADPSSQRPAKKPSKSELKKSTGSKGHGYYSEAFALRETGPIVPKTSPVWVELKTNVILENEFEFTKSFSQVIAKRYSRTEDTVAISVEHSACLIMGGNFEGCYLLTINSLSSISATCNKRNTALISEWINTNLGVPSTRGYIRFVEPDIANYAVGGVTMLDQMEKEKLARMGSTTSNTHHHNSLPLKDKPKRGIMGSIGSRNHNHQKPSQLERIVDRQPSSKGTTHRAVADENYDTVPDLEQVSASLSKLPQSQQTEKPIKRGRSMFNLFGRSQKA